MHYPIYEGCLPGTLKVYFRTHFHQKQPLEMIRKFAALALIAGVFAACGGGKTPEQIEAEAKALADSLTKATEQAMKDAEAAAQAAADSAAAAAQQMADTVTTKVEDAGGH
jgi:hypothetical protein